MTSTLTTNQTATLRHVAEDLGAELTTDYSGRAMYGRTCVGAIVDGHAATFAFRFGLAVAAYDEELADLLSGETVATDSMGLGSIIYLPNVTATAADDEDSDR